MGRIHYEHIPERGPEHQYRVADESDDVITDFATEEEAQRYVREHNGRLGIERWRF